MAIKITQQYTAPTTGVITESTLTADLVEVRPDTITAPKTICLKVSGASYSYLADIDDLIQNCLDGKRTRFGTGKYGTRLSALYDEDGGDPDTLTVEDATLLALTIGDIFSITDGTTVEYGIVRAFDEVANTIDFSALDGVSAIVNKFQVDYVQGSLVTNHSLSLADTLSNAKSLGFYDVCGVNSQLERIPILTSTEITNVGGSGTITVTLASTYSAPETLTSFDIYVRTETDFSKIPIYWIPDATDKTLAQMLAGVSITTYGGGVAAGGLGTLPAADYSIAVVAKKATGFNNVDESLPYVEEGITVS